MAMYSWNGPEIELVRLVRVRVCVSCELRLWFHAEFVARPAACERTI